MYKIILFIVFICIPQAHAMFLEETNKNAHIQIFKKEGPIKLSLEETIPDYPNIEKAISLLKSPELELVKTDKTSSEQATSKKDVGFNFPSIAPWCLITTKFIKAAHESSGERISLGDWGCGHGFFARHAVISGANPYVIEFHREAAQEANKNIFGVKAYLPKDLDIKTLYKVFPGSVTNPPNKFMDRKNHINVSFNVLHHLNPSDGDLLLKNIFENTVKDGLVVLCCDTPFGSPIDANYYNQSLAMGFKYPGFGLYTKSNIVFKSNLKRQLSTLLSIHRLTEEEIPTFKTCETHNGSYPKNELLDDTKTIFVDDPSGTGIGNILNESKPYYYQNFHQVLNKFDYPALKNIIEAVGFTAVNGWYTDHTVDALYPHNTEIDSSSCKKSKVIIVAQKK